MRVPPGTVVGGSIVPGTAAAGPGPWAAAGTAGVHEIAPAVLGRVLAGGLTRLPGPAPTVLRAHDEAALTGTSMGVRTDRVAPPRMSIAPPVAVVGAPGVRPGETATGIVRAATRPSGSGPLPTRPDVPAAGTVAGTAAPGWAAPPAAGPTGAAHPAGTAGPSGQPAGPSEPPGGPEPPARWRLTDLDPADLAELADLVLERIEGRVRGELERRGRRGVPGVF
ncbi:hypothetical protein [Jiangella endophytica]|uniref:hypothetical protein n=1 Tax=Jiangella endophytica TaxID=1623398 RepID=UPI001300AB25|nr:hypothetical protein [Jiangella endophytica]